MSVQQDPPHNQAVFPLKSLGLFSLMLVATTAAVTLQIPRLNTQLRSANPAQADLQRRQTIRTTTTLGHFGLTNLAADLLWLDFIQYFGNQSERFSQGYGLGADYLEAITSLDPQFIQPYTYAIMVYAWKLGQPEAGIAFLEKGTAHVNPATEPQAYRLWYHIALMQSLWVGNFDAAQIAFNHTADWLEVTPAEQRKSLGIALAPNTVRSWGESFKTNPGSAQLRYDIWLQVYHGTTDPEGRKFALEQIAKLGGIQRNPDGTFQFVRPSADTRL
jgi:hypothetical protein